MSEREITVGRINFGPGGKQKPDLTKLRVAPPEIRSTDWMDALRERFERRHDELDTYPETEYGIRTGIGECLVMLKQLRAEIESASIGGDMRRLTAQKTSTGET